MHSSGHVCMHAELCNAKTNNSNCLFDEWAVTVILRRDWCTRSWRKIQEFYSAAPGFPVKNCAISCGNWIDQLGDAMVTCFPHSVYVEHVLAVTRRWTNVGLMSVHRLRRWTTIKPTLVQRLVPAGIRCLTDGPTTFEDGSLLRQRPMPAGQLQGQDGGCFI